MRHSTPRIVFHGENATSFSNGFGALLGQAADINLLPDRLESAADRQTYAEADIIIGVRFDASLPRPESLRLFHVPGAGYDSVDLNALPPHAMVCNCFGHETAIAEYVMAALLQRYVPLAEADRRLREGDWAYWAGAPERVHGELAGTTIGLLGFGHIAKAIAKRARAFDLKVHVANRSAVDAPALVDQYFPLTEMKAFWGSADAFVVTVPLGAETLGIVGNNAFAAMRDHAVLINVARGPVVDEAALFAALRDRRIGGAVIDAWYRYPSADEPNCSPSNLPFQDLPGLVMTPHMSGWTTGTIKRRQQVIAENVGRRLRGEACFNVVRPA